MSKLLHEAAAKILFTRATNGQAIFMGQAIKAVPKVKEKIVSLKLKREIFCQPLIIIAIKMGSKN